MLGQMEKKRVDIDQRSIVHLEGESSPSIAEGGGEEMFTVQSLDRGAESRRSNEDEGISSTLIVKDRRRRK